MRRFALALLATLIVGCEPSSNFDVGLAPTDGNVAGTFNLQSVNGQVPPIVATATLTMEYDLSADQLLINSDGTWTETTTIAAITLGGGTPVNQTVITSGKYTITNGQINFVMLVGGSETFIGSVNGTHLFLRYNNSTFAYLRA